MAQGYGEEFVARKPIKKPAVKRRANKKQSKIDIGVKIAAGLFIVFGLGIIMNKFIPKEEINYSPYNRKYASKSYMVCEDEDEKIVFEGYSETTIVYDGQTGEYSFTLPGKGYKIKLKASCSVDSSKEVRAEYDSIH